MLDKREITFTDEFKIKGAEEGTLTIDPSHKINHENFSYHRKIHGYD